MNWGIYALDPQAFPGLPGAVVITLALLANVALTVFAPGTKVRLVKALQRRLINPAVKGLFRLGINPLGLALLETRGRRTGRPRVTPVGLGGRGSERWLVAEHGLRANYVRNLQADPSVRVRVRRGLSYVWVDAVATAVLDDDPIRRQRKIVGWNPLRALNALTVRILGADLLSVRLELVPMSHPSAIRCLNADTQEMDQQMEEKCPVVSASPRPASVDRMQGSSPA